jgi:hypothetical protein
MIYVKRKRETSSDLRDRRAEFRAEQADARCKGQVNKVDFAGLLCNSVADLVTSFLMGIEAHRARRVCHRWHRSLRTSQIVDLGASVCDLSDYSSSSLPLREHQGLRQLELKCSFRHSTAMVQWGPTFAAAFPSLHTLIIHVQQSHQQVDLELSPLSTLVNLQALALADVKFTPTSLAALRQLPRLRKLDLTENNRLETKHFEAVATLLQLRELVLVGCRQIGATDLNLLTVLPKLNRLNLADCVGIKYTVPLFSKFVSVTDLNIAQCQLQHTHLSGEVVRMPALQRLHIGPSETDTRHVQEFQKNRPDVITMIDTEEAPLPTLYPESRSDQPFQRYDTQFYS